MRPITVKKLALLFALFAFAVLAFGSAAMGARFSTAFIRGLQAAAVFGVIAWGLGTLLIANRPSAPVDNEQETQNSPVDERV